MPAREHQPEAAETPFDSIESAHEYITLLAVQVGVVRDALADDSRTPQEKPPGAAATRCGGFSRANAIRRQRPDQFFGAADGRKFSSAQTADVA